jgi:hypothetical protein
VPPAENAIDTLNIFRNVESVPPNTICVCLTFVQLLLAKMVVAVVVPNVTDCEAAVVVVRFIWKYGPTPVSVGTVSVVDVEVLEVPVVTAVLMEK